MIKLLESSRVYCSSSSIANAGRGVFARKKIKQGEVIEECPVIVVPNKDMQDLKKTILVNYYFCFAKDESQWALALGFGSLYNHSYEPNATYTKKYARRVILITAIKDISKDEEITVNYNSGNPNDKTHPFNAGVPPFKPKTKHKA